ncbi:deoxyribonuclease NucA/NucB [Nocardia pseudobrasiliensis]|uniref:Deoxyribonuclease NucA/NucB n=2 Tax=Nocardia pseudobrasiliensis TaxID=45979 RepID=A0A370IF27_9NOCA|nr:deoxyribonuclease NucA/NucB [Nocardia pseudobrasiliensis]
MLGNIPYHVQTGVLSSHRTGEMHQEFKISFDEFRGEVGSPTFKYKPEYVGFGSDQFSVSGPASGTSITARTTVTLVIVWKEHDMADYDIVNRVMRLHWNFGNHASNIFDSTSGHLEVDQFRCDTTFKNNQQRLQQGCVVPKLTPQFELTGTTPELTGHVERAIASGLPGTAARPLHRQTDRTTIDINRQTSCPASGPVRDGRRIGDRQCDEYPMASTTEGAASTRGPGRTFNPECHVPDLGASTDPNGYSVCMINKDHNQDGGRALGTFYADNRVVNQDPFTVHASGGVLPPIP